MSPTDELIKAGYWDPDVIKAVRGNGTFLLFRDSDVAAMMRQLSALQQLQLITVAEQYQKMHPGLNSSHIYSGLRCLKIKVQTNFLWDEIIGRTGDRELPGDVSNLKTRLERRVKNPIDSITDPFILSGKLLDGYYGNLTGIWGEWSMINTYYQQGNLVAFSIQLFCPEGEIDLKINENGVEKWLEVKNAKITGPQWSKALKQAEIYAQNGGKDIVVVFLQEHIKEVSELKDQQLKNLKQLEKQYPDVNFEVRTGKTDPSLRIPFEPPSDDWGSYLFQGGEVDCASLRDV